MRTHLIFLCLLLWIAGAAAQSPYAGEQERRVKAFSNERLAGLEAGRGLGYAKAAELNGYPGPKHVLELADELDLDADQRRHTEALYETMRERASALGRELIEAEAELDAAFDGGDITRQLLVEHVSSAARIESELRLVHLQTHLEQAELLTEDQIETYNQLRGYGSDPDHITGHGHHDKED